MKPGSARLPVFAMSSLAAEPLLDLGALRARALVVPEDRGAEHLLGSSSTTSPCIWPERPIEVASTASAASAASAARHQSSGSCSAQPGRGVESP